MSAMDPDELAALRLDALAEWTERDGDETGEFFRHDGYVLYVDDLRRAAAALRGTELVRLRAQVATLSAALRIALVDMHPTYGSTAGPGGVGGQAMTRWCHIARPRGVSDEVLTSVVLYQTLMAGIEVADGATESASVDLYAQTELFER